MSYKSKHARLDKIALSLSFENRSEQLLSECSILEASLHEFLKAAWHVVEGKSIFMDGWHIKAICEHLEAAFRGDIKNLLINIPPRTSKPVGKDTLLLTSTGERKRIADINVGDKILTHLGRFRTVKEKYHQGYLDTLEIETRGRRKVIAGLDHPFLTATGWKMAKELECEDVVGIPTVVEDFGNEVSPEEARLLGYLVGDGCLSANQLRICCSDEQRIEDLKRCADKLGFNFKITQYHRKDHYLKMTRITFSKGTNAPREWVRKHECQNKNSYTKRIPKVIMEGNFNAISNFLGAYWSCDGEISGKGYKRDGGTRRDIQIGISSVNEHIMKDVQHLLSRLGINSTIRRNIRKKCLSKKQIGDEYISYRLWLRNQNDVSRFLKRIVVYGNKINRITGRKIIRTEFDNLIMPDEIISIKPFGLEDCYCLNVEEDNTFTANDIIVHNTTIVSIMWPAWIWANRPSTKFLYASYKQQISWDHSRLCRLLIESPWYQERWGHIVKLSKDQDTKGHFTTTALGHRIATSVNSGGTALGGDILVCDDPNSTDESKVIRESTNEWVSRVWASRLNPGGLGINVIMQQRTDALDVSGYTISMGSSLVKLVLPMEFDSSRKSKTIVLPSTNGMIWEDPRQKDGELLCPDYLDKASIDAKKKMLGSYNYAGQYQQSPAPEEGGIYKKHYWKIWKHEKPPKLDFVLQSWDTALTKKETSAYSACTTWGIFEYEGYKNLILLSAWRGRVTILELFERAKRLRNNWSDIGDIPIEGMNYKMMPDRIVIEAKASGYSLSQDFSDKGIPVHDFNPGKYGDKMQRALKASPYLEAGLIWVASKPPSYIDLRSDQKMVVEECALFPKGETDDIPDTVSQAVIELVRLGQIKHKMDYGYLKQEEFKDENRPGYIKMKEC